MCFHRIHYCVALIFGNHNAYIVFHKDVYKGFIFIYDIYMNKKYTITDLIDVMARLRDPETGCPWDKEQTYETILPCTIEEVYEVADAIDNKDYDNLQEELGDLLFQVIYYAQFAHEENRFDFNDIVNGITSKMISRHPHVFGSEHANDAEHVKDIWEVQKAKEKKANPDASALDGVPLALPGVKRAQKIQKKAAKTGFEWANAEDVLDKFEEEIKEMREAISNGDEAEIKDELGDLFFVLTNFGRKLGVDCEEAIRHANLKFERRFRGMETQARQKNIVFSELTLDEQDVLWEGEKEKERKVS